MRSKFYDSDLFQALFLHMTMVTVDSKQGGLNEKGPHRLLCLGRIGWCGLVRAGVILGVTCEHAEKGCTLS